MFLFLPESVESHQRSFDLGIQLGHQRRNKVVLLFPLLRRQTSVNAIILYVIVDVILVQLIRSR